MRDVFETDATFWWRFQMVVFDRMGFFSRIRISHLEFGVAFRIRVRFGVPIEMIQNIFAVPTFVNFVRFCKRIRSNPSPSAVKLPYLSTGPSLKRSGIATFNNSLLANQCRDCATPKN